jgi:hypothetical protein
MLILAALCGVTGLVLGLRFRVTILVPVNAIIVAIVVTLNILQGNTLSSAVIEPVVAVLATELGYLCGATARLLLPSSRLRAFRDLRGPDTDNGRRHGANEE